MWLRHALKFLVTLFVLSACSPATDRQAVDKLNSLSYAYHYCSIDSTVYYACEALRLAGSYSDGKAEALNNLAFADIMRMDYDAAMSRLDSIPLVTDNQIELFVSYVQQMRLCQRRSQNREFYDYREKALRAQQRLQEDRASLTQEQLQRVAYAESELALVTSTYYYYVGLERQSVQAIDEMPSELELDEAQLLNYLYNVGAGGIIIQGTQEEINQQEFELLVRCYQLASQSGYIYFEANALEAIAEHLMPHAYREQLLADNPPAIKLINPDDIPADELPLWLAGRALVLFQSYGDTYQIAGAYRTLASCYVIGQGDFESAIYNLEMALADSTILLAPDLVASIHEQMSIAYAAIDNTIQSRQHRDKYLNLQEQTRQDRGLEAQVSLLGESVNRLHQWLFVVLAAIGVLMLLLVYLFWRQYKESHEGGHESDILQEQEEELQEQMALARRHVEKGERMALEQRAKVSLVNSITPLIDRMIHAIARRNDSGQADYVRELLDTIDEQNGVLTHWIQLRQGELSLHIETFALQDLFSLVGRSKSSFAMKGIELNVESTPFKVKADKVLTLFMLNTLADNARKATRQGGKVDIRATEGQDYVEVSVADTGIGMDEAQLAHLFDRKGLASSTPSDGGERHGFGLLNCKGIIEKYRKLSSIFSVCLLSAESRKGEGSRFFFRLPKGVVRTVLLLFLANVSYGANGTHDTYGRLAAEWADSLKKSNEAGLYDKSLFYGSECLRQLNRFYHDIYPEGIDTLTLMGDPSAFPNDILWYDDSLQLDFTTLLTLRNELSLTALALHEWPLYRYNNRIFTLLYHEMSADRSLDYYYQRMQQAQSNSQVAIVLFVILLLAIFIAVVWIVVSSLNRLARRQQEQQSRLELLTDELHRLRQEEARLHVSNAVLDNTLSALKHETMYYPSRIRQLLDADEDTTPEALNEVVGYYRELYAILSQQAMSQVSHRLQVGRIEKRHILGNETLIDYLIEILQKQTGGQKLQVTFMPHGQQYVEARVELPASGRSDANLFSSQVQNIPFLLCREIVREHGEATGRRSCGMRAELSPDGQRLIVIITLPSITQ